MPDRFGTEGPGEGLDRPQYENPFLDRASYPALDSVAPLRSRACQSCVFSAPMPAQQAALSCRRHPPVVAIVRLKTAGMPSGLDISGFTPPEEMLQALTNFPSVQPDEWCGEYESTAEPTAADD